MRTNRQDGAIAVYALLLLVAAVVLGAFASRHVVIRLDPGDADAPVKGQGQLAVGVPQWCEREVREIASASEQSVHVELEALNVADRSVPSLGSLARLSSTAGNEAGIRDMAIRIYDACRIERATVLEGPDLAMVLDLYWRERLGSSDRQGFFVDLNVGEGQITILEVPSTP